MKSDIVSFIFFAVILLGGLWYAGTIYRQEITHFFTSDSQHTILVGSSQLRADVADTSEARGKGLGGRDALDVNEGMIFIFDTEDKYRMWMKNMLFPIDIIWVDNNRRIVDIKENVQPETYPETFSPRAPARFVIETNAFWTSEHNVARGQTVVIPEIILPKDLQNNLFTQ